METPISALALAASGLAIFFGGAALLGEYRQAFMQNPRTVMTSEIVTMLAQRGGVGYTTIVMLTSGVIITPVGFALFVLTLLV